MIRKIARYQVKAEFDQEVIAVIEAFVAAIGLHEPETFYAAYRQGEERWFLHYMSFPDEAAEAKHQKAAYTMKFVDALYPNCEVQPKFTDLPLVASAGRWV
jgi:quinol monooxygenase YgiN